MGLTRRKLLAGGLVAGAAIGCGRTGVFTDEDADDVPVVDLADSGSEDDMQNPAYIPVDSTPIHVAASAQLQSNTSVGVNTVSLRNPMDRPMEILEIKWQVSVASLTGGDFALLVAGAAVGCKLDLGSIPITNGFVPIWSFGRCINYQREATAASAHGVGIYTWRLPYPLYVPKGAVLAPSIQHRGLFPGALNVRVSYSGRSLPEGYRPKKVRLPYAAAWVTDNFNINTAGSDSSSETDLVNPFDEPLEVSALTGRLFHIPTSSFSNMGDTAVADDVKVKMRESGGRAVIGTYTPFRAAFPWATRSWEMGPGFVLGPKAFYIADVKLTPPGPPYDPSVYVQGFIGLVGSREVA